MKYCLILILFVFSFKLYSQKTACEINTSYLDLMADLGTSPSSNDESDLIDIEDYLSEARTSYVSYSISGSDKNYIMALQIIVANRAVKLAEQLDNEGYESLDFASYCEEIEDLYVKDLLSDIKSASIFGDVSLSCSGKRYSLSSSSYKGNLYNLYYNVLDLYFILSDGAYYDADRIAYQQKGLAVARAGSKIANEIGRSADDNNFLSSNAFWLSRALKLKDFEALSDALKYAEEFPKYSQATIEDLFVEEVVNYKDAAKYIESIRAASPTLFSGGAADYRMAVVMNRMKDYNDASEYYMKAFNNGKKDRYFINETIEFMLNNSQKEKAKVLADELNKLINRSQCSDLSMMIGIFERTGQTQSAASVKLELVKCNAEEIKRKKEDEKRRKKEARGKINMVMSTFPLSFYAKDWAASLEFANSKRAWELGFRNMKENNELFVSNRGSQIQQNPVDKKYRYGGNRYFFSYKRLLENKPSSPFVGFRLQQSQKTFNDIVANVYNTNNNLVFSNAVFSPEQTQYEVFFISGMRAQTRTINMEILAGIGTGMRSFTVKGPQADFYDSNTAVIDDALMKRVPQSPLFLITGSIRFGLVF